MTSPDARRFQSPPPPPSGEAGKPQDKLIVLHGENAIIACESLTGLERNLKTRQEAEGFETPIAYLPVGDIVKALKSEYEFLKTPFDPFNFRFRIRHHRLLGAIVQELRQGSPEQVIQAYDIAGQEFLRDEENRQTRRSLRLAMVDAHDRLETIEAVSDLYQQTNEAGIPFSFRLYSDLFSARGSMGTINQFKANLEAADAVFQSRLTGISVNEIIKSTRAESSAVNPMVLLREAIARTRERQSHAEEHAVQAFSDSGIHPALDEQPSDEQIEQMFGGSDPTLDALDPAEQQTQPIRFYPSQQ